MFDRPRQDPRPFLHQISLWAGRSVKASAEERVSRAADETQKFIDEIERSADLDELSRVPLLLLLFSTCTSKAPLPPRRFRAYDIPD
jgi:hypothetical protein